MTMCYSEQGSVDAKLSPRILTHVDPSDPMGSKSTITQSVATAPPDEGPVPLNLTCLLD